MKILVLKEGVITIREYKPSDRQACFDIFKSNAPLYFAEQELPLLENWLNAKDKNQIAYKNNLAENFYVVEHESGIVACGGFYITAEQNAHMTWGMVKNSFHKNGIGKYLLLYRIEEIKEFYPGHSILLDTTQHTYYFFEKFGFVVTNIKPQGYSKELDRYDMSMD